MMGNDLRSLKRLIALLACLTACREPADAGPTSFEPVLSARELWSGGTATLSDPWFKNTSPIVVLGTDTLTVTRLDSTTLLLLLPRTAGTLPLSVIAGTQWATLGDVTLHGFQSFRLGPFMSGQPYWLPGGGAPRVMAGANEGAAIVDLHTLMPVYTLPDSISTPDCTWTPSPTHRPDRFVMIGKRPNNQCGNAKLWSLTDPPVAFDSISTGGTWYTSGQPSPGRWVFNWNNHNVFYICEPSCAPPKVFNTVDIPNGITISPRADRFLWLPAERPVVYDAISLDTAFVLAAFSRLQGAFSFEGDTLALTATDTPYHEHVHVLLVRAEDGAVLRDMQVDTLYRDGGAIPGPVAFDPTRPWLYATMFSWSTGDTVLRPSVIVLDRANWTVLGVLETAEGSLPYFWLPTAIVPSPVENRVYLVGANNGYGIHGTRGLIFQYSTP